MCNSTGCEGCAYSKLSVLLLHKVPHRECYKRFVIRHLPWNVLSRVVNKMKMQLQKEKGGIAHETSLHADGTITLKINS